MKILRLTFAATLVSSLFLVPASSAAEPAVSAQPSAVGSQPSALSSQPSALSSQSSALSSVDHYVYLSFLPKASELRQDAEKNGLTILGISEEPGRVVVSYRYPDGHEATLGYALKGSRVEGRVSNNESQNYSYPPAAYSVPPTAPQSQVVYVERPATTVVYRDYYSDPWVDFWAPLTLGVGLGWATTWHGGHYYHSGWHGGYHGGWHGGHGWRR